MKHVLHFTVGDDGVREFAVETDDLRDVASWSWFRDFLALKGGYAEPSRETIREDPRIADLKEMLDAYARENKRMRQIMEDMQRREAPPMSIQEPVSPPPAAPVQQAPVPLVRGTDPFSLNPNQMTEQVWGTMNPQMQDQWMKKWGIGQ